MPSDDVLKKGAEAPLLPWNEEKPGSWSGDQDRLAVIENLSTVLVGMSVSAQEGLERLSPLVVRDLAEVIRIAAQDTRQQNNAGGA